MKITGITIFTNPDYRQDPARECVRQMLEVCDEAVIVYGWLGDQEIVEQLQREYPGRIRAEYLDWPQPEWTLEELPKHLNYALAIARYHGADWIIKFDSDSFIHEKDAADLRLALEQQLDTNVLAMMLEKANVLSPNLVLQKSDVPFCIKAKSPIVYGQDLDHYTDLCQPILWDNISYCAASDEKLKIPAGRCIARELIKRTGIWQYNYGYSFKTYDRARELLYWFDIAHIKWWGVSWFKRSKQALSEDVSMADYLTMMRGRIKKATKRMELRDHPKHIQQRLRTLEPEQFAYNFWGLINMPVKS